MREEKERGGGRRRREGRELISPDHLKSTRDVRGQGSIQPRSAPDIVGGISMSHMYTHTLTDVVVVAAVCM